MNPRAPDVSILGGGLAGILLAEAIEHLGGTAVIADEERPNAASRMAPGIINPLAGRKFKVNADYAASHAETMQTFARLADRMNRSFWHPLPMVRLLENADQATFLEDRREAPEAGPWLGRAHPPGAHGAAIHDPFGSFETRGAGWLDVPGLVEAARSSGEFRFVPVAEAEAAAPVVVDCRGWRCSEDAHWRALPWKCARGETLTIRLDGSLPERIWNGGGWLQPIGNGLWRAGATYAWSGFEAPPQLTAQAELIGKLRRWMKLPFALLEQQAGVRAVVIDYRPVLGALPSDPRRHIFSGLGSHGAIQGPPYAAVLARHLLEGAPLPPDVAVSRFG